MEERKLSYSDLLDGKRYYYWYQGKLYIFTLINKGRDDAVIIYGGKIRHINNDGYDLDFFELPLSSLEKELV